MDGPDYIPISPHCLDGSTERCVPFQIDDLVRLYYGWYGIPFVERCVHCRRLILDMPPRRTSPPE